MFGSIASGFYRFGSWRRWKEIAVEFNADVEFTSC